MQIAKVDHAASTPGGTSELMARMRRDQARELLSVSSTATPDALRKAYKKAALRWHPDKNPDNREHVCVDAAALQFRRGSLSREAPTSPHGTVASALPYRRRAT